MADTVHELTAAYALDALDDHEAREYEEHLRRCDRCRSELGSLQEVASLLAYGAEPVAPPPGSATASSTPPASSGRKSCACARAGRIPLAAGAAIAAGLAIGLGIWATSLSHSLDRERQRAALLDSGRKSSPCAGGPAASSSRRPARRRWFSPGCPPPRAARRTRPGSCRRVASRSPPASSRAGRPGGSWRSTAPFRRVRSSR